MSDKLTDQRLKEIEERANAATPGPWFDTYTYHGAKHYGAVKSNGKVICETKVFDAGEHEADAKFIAHSRADIDALLSEVKRLQAETAELKQIALDITEKYGTSVKMHKITSDLNERLQAELDAAIETIHIYANCSECIHNARDKDGHRIIGLCKIGGCEDDKWEYRGVKGGDGA